MASRFFITAMQANCNRLGWDRVSCLFGRGQSPHSTKPISYSTDCAIGTKGWFSTPTYLVVTLSRRRHDATLMEGTPCSPVQVGRTCTPWLNLQFAPEGGLARLTTCSPGPYAGAPPHLKVEKIVPQPELL